MVDRWHARRTRFRDLLGGDACYHPASVHDALSARLAQDLGFEIGMLAGSVASLAVLGAPDLILITLSEFAEQARRIGRAAELPMMVDSDHGYGNALNVMRTVEELEMAGVAGLSIEDTELPQGFGSGRAARLIPLEEGVGKMRAALAARRDPDLVIAGRTSAAAITGVGDAIRRVKAYAAAGVDAIFLVGIPAAADLEAICAEVRLPVILGGVPAGLADRAWLAQRGVRICLQGHQPIQAAVQAMHATMRALRDGVAPDALPGLAPPALTANVTRAGAYAEAVRRFLEPQ